MPSEIECKRSLGTWHKKIEGQVYDAAVSRGTHKVSDAVAAPGPGSDRKFPAAVGNSHGEVLLAWTEGTAWKRGGSLAWQVFDKEGRPTEVKGGAPGVQFWGSGGSIFDPAGRFCYCVLSLAGFREVKGWRSTRKSGTMSLKTH